MKITHIVYHNADLDGICSAAIVAKHAQENGYLPELYPANNGDSPSPELLAALAEHDPESKLYILDFSYSPLEMERLYCLCPTMVWIDHHARAIDYSKTQLYGASAGSRVDGTAACQLTQNFLYPDDPIPLAILYLAMWDVGEVSSTVRKFQYYCRAKLPMFPVAPQWENLLAANSNEVFEWAHQGQIIVDYEMKLGQKHLESAFPCTFLDRPCVAINAVIDSYLWSTPTATAMFPDAVIGISFTWDPSRGTWRFSLRHGPAAPANLNLSELANSFFGGGGHAKAAGFNYTSANPFEILKGATK